MKKIIFFIYCLGVILLPNLLLSQIEYSAEFKKALEQGQIEFSEPLENRFKTIPILSNEFQTYDLAIQSKEKGKMEIRYAIDVLGDNNANFFPHVTFMTKVTTIASNEEDSVVAFHGIENTTLVEEYNADWGASVFFKPKQGFSTREHCKMIALFAENKAMVYIFFLFDDPSIDLRKYFEDIRFF